MTQFVLKLICSSNKKNQFMCSPSYFQSKTSQIRSLEIVFRKTSWMRKFHILLIIHNFIFYKFDSFMNTCISVIFKSVSILFMEKIYKFLCTNLFLNLFFFLWNIFFASVFIHNQILLFCFFKTLLQFFYYYENSVFDSFFPLNLKTSMFSL